MPGTYLEILALQDPFTIGQDTSKRTVFSCNYRGIGLHPVDWEEDLKTLIVNAGLGVFGTNLFIGPAVVLPSGNGPFIRILNTGGNSPLESHDGIKQRRLSAQITVTALSYEDGMNKSEQIWSLLDGLRNVTV